MSDATDPHVSLLALEEWTLTAEGQRFVSSLLESLSLLDPDEVYGFLDRLRTLEVERHERDQLEALRRDVAAAMRRAPLLMAAVDVTEAAEQTAWLLLKRNVDFIFLASFSRDTSALVDRIHLEGFDVLDAARKDGPVIVAGFHVGPNEVGIGTLAVSGYPLTLVSSFPPDRPSPSYLPMLGSATSGMDMEVVSSADPRVLLQCVRALRRERVLMIFPEFAFEGARRYYKVSFMGADVGVPTSIGDLAHRTGARIVVCHVRATGHGRYGCFVGPVVELSPEGPQGTTQRLFRAAERLILDRNPGEWELWPFYSRMLDLGQDPATQ